MRGAKDRGAGCLAVTLERKSELARASGARLLYKPGCKQSAGGSAVSLVCHQGCRLKGQSGCREKELQPSLHQAASLGGEHVQAVGGGSGNHVGLWVPGQMEHLGAQILVQHILRQGAGCPRSPVGPP